MNRFAFSVLILVMTFAGGCSKKDIRGDTVYTGTIVEQNSLSPIPNLQVSITDGINVISEAVTNSIGQFSILLADGGRQGHLYVFIDGNGIYPSKKLDLIYTEEAGYDYGLIYLYNQTDASLYPTIENVDWDYTDDNAIRFKDIVIKSDYLLTEAYVEIAKNASFTQSEKCLLETQMNGRYSVDVGNFTVGELYYFRVVATNTIGTGRSEVYCRKFGFPIPSIVELLNATINTATIKMTVVEEPLSTVSAGLCWSTSHNPTVNNNMQSGGNSVTSDITITGLDFRTTTYYVRAFAENDNGIAYSEELALPANNPYCLPTFTSGGNTYSYVYMGCGSWYTAYDACASFVFVFDDWTLPPINIMPDFFNTYYAENAEVLPLPVWSMRRNAEDEENESETFMLTYNGNVLAPKTQSANYYAVRKW